MSNNPAAKIAFVLFTAGGRIRCARCQALSKRTKLQCGAPSIRNQNVCRTHGGKSTGPKTVSGRKKCADAKKIHGRETRKIRIERSLILKKLRNLEPLVRRLIPK
jgi:pyruvate-formate lyase-activating enzyme